MKGSKILAIIVVFAMILSTMVVMERLDIGIIDKASAVPGVDDWGYPTNTTDEDLVYDPDSMVDIDINTSGLNDGESYYLYYPVYDRSGTTYNLTWKPYKSSGVQKRIQVGTAGNDATLENIYLNRSGLWVLNHTELVATIDGGDWASFNATVNKWFWVNTSSSYKMTVDPDEVYYGDNTTISVTVKDSDGDATESWLDVRRDKLTEPVVTGFPKIESDGAFSFSSDWKSTLEWAGNYSVFAWTDLDDEQPLYQSLSYGFNDTFGSSDITAGYYDYTICGPWDPPEYNTSVDMIYVQPGEPSAPIRENNQTMYWNFYGEVNISVTDYDDNNISDLKVLVLNDDDENVTANVTVDQSDGGNGERITIKTANWGKNATSGHIYGGNGTWFAYIFKDEDGDRDATKPNTHKYTEEWNITAEWTVTRAPGSQFKWIDDDGVLSNDDNDGICPEVPGIGQQPVDIKFQIINREGEYYGDDASNDANAPEEKGENITVTGDALYLGKSTKSLDKLPGVSYSGGTWTVPLTPTMAMDGGEIVFKSKWKGSGTVTETLNIGGSRLNGTIVTISPSEFLIDENITLTVTVKYQNYAVPNARIELRYISDTTGALINTSNALIEERSGGGTVTGEYEFFINRTQQTDNQTAAYGEDAKAPRNISAYVSYYRGGSPKWIHGYATAKMIPKSDLKVTMEPNAILAGEKIRRLYFNTTVVNDEGNSTDEPEDSDLKVRIYNESGEDVTEEIGSLSTSDTDGKAEKVAKNEYIQEPGTYTVYAYNNTHDSKGNNATLTVISVDVESSISEFIWGVDDNISSTFTVTYDGKPINGTLRIDNMTGLSDYNKTWANCSFSPTIGSTSGTDEKNESLEVDVENGAITINNITANNLSELMSGKWKQYSIKNITFFFKPDISGSAWAHAKGIVPVKIADVSASPGSLVYNKPATLTLTVTGRGTGLKDVWTSIMIPGLSGEMDTRTNAEGKATFAFTPPTTGKITIKIENRTSSTKVPIRSWGLYLDVDTQANEGVTFTATVRNGTAAGAAVSDATVTFNRVSKTTDASGQVTFDAPSVVDTREYDILATKEGFAEDSEVIYILNIPKLMIVVQGEVSAGATFDVIIADDSGNPVVGATITINEKTYTTGANGIATITAPSEEGTYTISATFPGYTDADSMTITIEAGGIPGFELLTLLAALGIAFILLRRRRH